MNIQIKNADTVNHVWVGQTVTPGTYYVIQAVELAAWANNSQLLIDIANGLAVVNNGTADFTDVNSAISYLKGTAAQLVTTTAPKTPDGKDVVATNRIPDGFTLGSEGASDDMVNGVYGGGQPFTMNDTSPGTSNKFTLQFMNNWYGTGGRVIWESAALVDSVNAVLVAPASTGWTNAAGNFNKYNIVGPYNMLVPASPGAGAWNVNLAATLNSNVATLASVPVPSLTNTGYFDYNPTTNVLTVNALGQGGYNLYDFPINLFRICNQVWGRKQDGAESVLESSDVVAKMMLSMWVVNFTLNNVTPGVKCGIIIHTARTKNI